MVEESEILGSKRIGWEIDDMSAENLREFTEDIKTIHPGFTKKRSSLKGLLDHLDATKANPAVFSGMDNGFFQALGLCSAKGYDKRVRKYRPAIKRLTDAWGRAATYPRDKYRVLAFRSKEIDFLQDAPNATVYTIAYDAYGTVLANLVPAHFRGRVDCLIFHGGHGDFQHGVPAQMNGVDAVSVRQLVANLKGLNVEACTIVLDTCFSAGFIPVFRTILVKTGTIICHGASGPGPQMAYEFGNLQVDPLHKSNFKTVMCNHIQSVTTDFGMAYNSYSVYREKQKTLYVTQSNDNVSQTYIGQVGKQPVSEHADITAMHRYLQSQKINIRILANYAGVLEQLRRSVTV